MSKTKNTKAMLSLKCAACNTKKSRFIKEQEARGLSSQLRIKTFMSKIPLLGDFLFKCVKMKNMINTFFLAGDNFMPQMHMRQPEFSYGGC